LLYHHYYCHARCYSCCCKDHSRTFFFRGSIFLSILALLNMYGPCCDFTNENKPQDCITIIMFHCKCEMRYQSSKPFVCAEKNNASDYQ
jgi:hypothetical protein